MPESTDFVSSETPQEDNFDSLKLIDLEKLAEKIVKLLLRELEIENQRTGKSFQGR